MVENVVSEDVQRLLVSMGAAIDQLSELGIHTSDALRMLHTSKCLRGIPVSIFNKKLGALESIVKYMKEELFLDYSTIAYMLGRNVGPIGVTYRRSRLKFPERLDVSSKRSIEFNALRANGKHGLSVLESLAHNLVGQGYDWHEIAEILKRDDKTVWTVLDRARRKMKK